MTKRDAFNALASELAKPHREAVTNHLRIQHQVGQRAQTVVDHEGWQVFLDHVGEMERVAVARRDRLAAELLVAEDVVKRGEYRELVGEVRGYQLAAGLVPKLIERGQEAGKVLSAQDAAQTPVGAASA